MRRAGTHWTESELATAKAEYLNGADYGAIGAMIGRSAAAVYDMLRKKLGALPTPQPSYFDGPPIGITMDDERHQKDCRLGSQILREACMDLFCRTANRYMVSLDDAMACHLGYHAPPKKPGTERVYRGQAAERLAA